MVRNGRPNFNSLLFSGGLSKNDVYVQTHADICNIPAVVPYEDETVLLGTAMLAACAGGIHPTLEVCYLYDFLKFANIAIFQDAAREMGGQGVVLAPQEITINYHKKKYEVYLRMLDDQRAYSAIMSDAN